MMVPWVADLPAATLDQSSLQVCLKACTSSDKSLGRPIRGSIMLHRLIVGFLLWAATTFSAGAQSPDPRDIFAPLLLPNPASPTRSASGVPGPAYWQNRADYVITARIDPVAHVLTGHETITYTNNSPDALA